MPTPVTHIRIPVETLAAVDAAAAAEGVTRTRWVLAAVEARLYPQPVGTECPPPTAPRTVPTAEGEPVPTPRIRVVELVDDLEGSLDRARAAVAPCSHPLVRRVGRRCLDCDTRVT